MKSAATLVEEFDAIAEALATMPSGLERLSRAERDLLGHISQGARRGLDVGCRDPVMNHLEWRYSIVWTRPAG